MTSPSSPSLWSEPEVRFGAAAGLLFAATAVCRHLPTTEGALVLGAIVAGGALTLPARYAAGLGVAAWAFLTGFVFNAGGQLTFTAGDVRRAVMLVVAASVVACVAGAHRRSRDRSARTDDVQPAVLTTSSKV